MSARLVVHLIHRLAVGGLENGLINLINHTPPNRYRHAIICMTDHTDFRERLARPDVPLFALHKREGQDPAAYFRLWNLLRKLRPAILHTRTVGMLEGQIYAALAGVPGRIHGEHGQAIYSSTFRRFRHMCLRRCIQPLVHHHTAVSKDIAEWLVRHAVTQQNEVTCIYNGVDTTTFHPHNGRRANLEGMPTVPEGALVVGTVGRMQPVKDQLTLVKAFLHTVHSAPNGRNRLRLVIAGDGPLKTAAQDLLKSAGALDLAWLPGERHDIAAIMRGLDIFVLPSLSEGMSNTILEAMASGLPVIATQVGGNPELLNDGSFGFLTPPADPVAMSALIRRYLDHPELRDRHGQAARRIAQDRYSLDSMVNGYLTVYDQVLQRKASAPVSQVQA